MPEGLPRSSAAGFTRRRLLGGLLAVAVLGACIAVWQWQKAQRKEVQRRVTKEKSARAGELGSAQRAYVRELARFLGVPEPPGDSPDELLRLTANLHLRFNQTAPVVFSPRMYPWLGPVPPTFAARELEGARSLPIDLKLGEVTLDAPCTLFQYTVRNTGAQPAAAPLLFQNLRWDSAEALLATSGLAQIPDELDRAIAVWRFIGEHRTHFWPPTEGAEEHDLIKFLSVYGYGYCDDSARAVAMLAELCGLRSRVWFIHRDVHVVAEIFAGGKWRMFDADGMAYFHAPGAPRDVLSVEELSRDARLFENAFRLGPARPYDEQYVRAFTHPDGGHEIKPTDATAEHRIALRLLPGERAVFGNFNWGRYFLGKYPRRVPRYLNGFLELVLRPNSFGALPAAVHAEEEPGGFALRNESDREQEVRVEFASPFPIVGGRIAGTVASEGAKPAEARIEDREHRTLQRHAMRGELSLDSFVSLTAKTPTTHWTLGFTIAPRGRLHFRNCRVVRDFQFAEFALVRFQQGANTFRVHWPEGESDKWEATLNF